MSDGDTARRKPRRSASDDAGTKKKSSRRLTSTATKPKFSSSLMGDGDLDTTRRKPRRSASDAVGTKKKSSRSSRRLGSKPKSTSALMRGDIATPKRKGKRKSKSKDDGTSPKPLFSPNLRCTTRRNSFVSSGGLNAALVAAITPDAETEQSVPKNQSKVESASSESELSSEELIPRSIREALGDD